MGELCAPYRLIRSRETGPDQRARVLWPTHWRPSALVLVALFAGLTPAAAAAPRLVNGAGATLPYPLYSKWFHEYTRIAPEVRFNYQSIGSGGGIRQVTERTVDFGASDAPMTDEQLRKAPGLIHVPTVLGAVVVTYNLPGTPRFASRPRSSRISSSGESPPGTTPRSRPPTRRSRCGTRPSSWCTVRTEAERPRSGRTTCRR